jgi:hypothetical protein
MKCYGSSPTERPDPTPSRHANQEGVVESLSTTSFSAADEDAYDVAAYITAGTGRRRRTWTRIFRSGFRNRSTRHTAHTPTVSARSATQVRSVRPDPRKGAGNLPRCLGLRAQADQTTDRMNFDAPDRRRRSLYCRFSRIRGNSAGANSCSGFVRRRIDKNRSTSDLPGQSGIALPLPLHPSCATSRPSHRAEGQGTLRAGYLSRSHQPGR